MGPFSAKQLLLRAGFDAHCLVCPEEHSDEENYWKEAHFYEEFGFDPREAPKPQAKEEAASAAQSEQFLKEMDTVMTELSSFNVGEKETPRTAAEKTAPKAKQPDLFAAADVQPAARPDLAQEAASAKPEAVAQDAAAAQNQTPAPQKETNKETVRGTDFERKISSILMQASKEMKQRKAPPSADEAAPAVPKDAAPQAQTKSADSVALQAEPEVEVVARTISKVSPIEEYFNTIKSGDLGNILGIPDAKENSDMSLARALESQFEKTEPGAKPETLSEEDPFDEFTPKQKPEEVDEELFASTPAGIDKKTEKNLKAALPDLKEAAALPLAGQTAAPQEDARVKTQPDVLQELVVPQQEDDPNDRTVKTILEGKLKVDTLRREIPEPIKDVPADDAKPAAPQAAEEDEEDDFLKERVVKRHPAGMMKFVFLGLGALVLLFGAWLNWTHGEEPAAQTAPAAEQTAAAQTPPPAPSAREAINAAPAQEPKDPLELAKEIVQNYQLGKGRGTVQEYLAKRYAEELASGYAAMWSAEPLHRDVYVVKYRLAKTRKEPVVYVFQADTAKKKLTGALNNITLDLVGKIR